MKILKATTAGLMLVAMPWMAQAEPLSYSYIDLGYVETDLDGGPNPDGIGVRGSIGFSENFFVFADYSNQDVGPFDIDQFAVGLGGHLGLSEVLDLVGRAGYIEADLSGSGFSIDDSGYMLSGGLRGRLGEQAELEGGVIYTDFGGNDGDDTAVAVGGRYFFTESFAVTAEYQYSDDASTILAGIRWSF